MSRVLGRFRARRLLPRAMEPPPALGFLLPPSERLPSCPAMPASPRLCRSLPSGLPAGTGERPLRRVGVPRGRRLSWGRTDLHANPGWEPGTTAGSGHPGWGAGFAELFLASPQLGSRPSARAHGRQGIRVAGPQPGSLGPNRRLYASACRALHLAGVQDAVPATPWGRSRHRAQQVGASPAGGHLFTSSRP